MNKKLEGYLGATSMEETAILFAKAGFTHVTYFTATKDLPKKSDYHNCKNFDDSIMALHTVFQTAEQTVLVCFTAELMSIITNGYKRSGAKSDEFHLVYVSSCVADINTETLTLVVETYGGSHTSTLSFEDFNKGYAGAIVATPPEAESRLTEEQRTSCEQLVKSLSPTEILTADPGSSSVVNQIDVSLITTQTQKWKSFGSR